MTMIEYWANWMKVYNKKITYNHWGVELIATNKEKANGVVVARYFSKAL